MFRDIAISKFKLLVCISHGKEERRLVDVLHTAGARGTVELAGEGCASSEMLELLGLQDNQRVITLSLVRVEDLDHIKRELAEKIYNKPGKGVALVIKVDGFIGLKSIFRLKMIEEYLHDLIVKEERQEKE